MSPDVYERLRTAADDETYAVYLEPPISPSGWERCLRRAREELGWEGLDWYRDLLWFSDGLQIDNAVFESATGLIQTNLSYREVGAFRSRFVLFGSSGNLDAYVLDLEAAHDPFLVTNFYGDFSSKDEITGRYPSLEALLSSLLDRETGSV